MIYRSDEFIFQSNHVNIVCVLNFARYRYVSKLTIKVLEEGFDLHGQLLALRRYHFMELADWVDLFIMSLWHHVSLFFWFYPKVFSSLVCYYVTKSSSDCLPLFL